MFHEAGNQHEGKEDQMGPCLDWERDCVRGRDKEKSKDRERRDTNRHTEAQRQIDMELEGYRGREGEGDRNKWERLKRVRDKAKEKRGREKQRDNRAADSLACIPRETGVFKWQLSVESDLLYLHLDSAYYFQQIQALSGPLLLE